MELKIQNITKRYRDKTAVNDVSITLTPGVWGLLGANGAGKTTLMRMLAGILRPSSGRILCDGVEIGTLGAAYREKLGYLPQEFGFYPEFTVQDYLEYMAALKGLLRTEAARQIDALLERVSLTEVRRKKIIKLSGGMKRRVGIAQALLNDPEILILDEPTAGLDPGERVRFRNLLSEFAQERIVLISTHIVSDVEYIAAENAVMKAGKMGAKITVDGKVATVHGIEKLHGATVQAHDLRAGAALVAAALAAEGETTIEKLGIIDRGYWRMEDKLKAIGCDVERVEE